jgi:hypothetical protein
MMPSRYQASDGPRIRSIARVSRFHCASPEASCLPGTRQRIEACFAVVVGGSPFGVDPAARFEPLQRRIERAVIHEQHVLRLLLDVAGDRLAVARSPDEGFQDQQVERALQERDAFGISVSGRHSTRA